ncbi:hypothetical protein K438DRAFT_1749660 [Mycena galopus ATCC 62051]|nr:hypothetical protein K438DRAFT_1749660 [Mycena galopus ATCC 62051]
MLRLLDIFLALLNRLFPLFPHHAMFPRSHAAPVNTNTEHEDEDTTDQNWYITSWGLISRNGELLSHLREPLHDASDDPVYFAPMFQEILDYLPLCSGFEGVFVHDLSRLYPQRPIYFAVDGDHIIYGDRFAAERAWLRQPDKFANVLATLSPSAALDHAAICAQKASHTHPYIIASS